MSSDRFIRIGQKLVHRFDTRDPYKIADGLGITVLERPDFGPLKGMYTVIKRNRFIFLNQNLPEDMKHIVLAHEIGHDQLHRDLMRNSAAPFREFSLYEMKSRPEYEANIVCSEILLDTEELLSYVYEGQYTAAEIARLMHSDANLIALKASYLTQQGHTLNRQDFRSDFLANENTPCSI